MRGPTGLRIPLFVSAPRRSPAGVDLVAPAREGYRVARWWLSTTSECASCRMPPPRTTGSWWCSATPSMLRQVARRRRRGLGGGNDERDKVPPRPALRCAFRRRRTRPGWLGGRYHGQVRCLRRHRWYSARQVNLERACRPEQLPERPSASPLRVPAGRSRQGIPRRERCRAHHRLGRGPASRTGCCRWFQRRRRPSGHPARSARRTVPAHWLDFHEHRPSCGACRLQPGARLSNGWGELVRRRLATQPGAR